MSHRRTLFMRNLGLPNLSGYDISHQYATFRTNLNTHSKAFNVKVEGATTNWVIDWGSDGTISGQSPYRNSASSGISGSWQTIIDANPGKKFYYRSLYNGLEDPAVITGNPTVGASQVAEMFDAAGAVITKNGIAAMKFLGVGFAFDGDALSVLDTGNDFSIAAVVSSETTANAQSFINTSVSANDRMSMLCERAAAKRHSLIRNSGATVYTCELDAQLDTANSRILHLTVNGTTGLMTPYLNGIAQADTENYTGSYTNDVFRIGAGNSVSNPLNGYLHGIWIAPIEWTAGQVASMTPILQVATGL